jgi:L-lactate dehydrogenase complex protein LldG
VEAALMPEIPASRDNILHRVRTALGRSAGQPPAAPPPPVRLRVPEVEMEDRIATLRLRVETLAGNTYRVPTQRDALQLVEPMLQGKSVVASNAPYLAECGIAALPGVRTGIRQVDALRDACAAADIGITSADYALSDTGTLVMIAGPAEARLVSLLPAMHLAIVPADRILTGLDELFTLLPRPADRTSSMVMITGPSRTADIEQILVRGVHGPGQITVVIVG